MSYSLAIKIIKDALDKGLTLTDARRIVKNQLGYGQEEYRHISNTSEYKAMKKGLKKKQHKEK